jgi:hypothetical protein
LKDRFLCCNVAVVAGQGSGGDMIGGSQCEKQLLPE